MRPTTTQSRNISLKSNSKSMANLHQLKKTSQNFPTLRNQLLMQKTNRASFKQSKSKGKLHLGNIAKPVMILSKQQRLNPWSKRAIISEQIVIKKGLLNLAHMGILSKQYDCIDLLNTKYELIPPRQKQIRQTVQKQAFLTNPAFLDTYYQVQQSQIEEQGKQKQKIEQKAIKRRSATKKIITKEQTKIEFILEDQVRLTVLNFHIERNEIYQQYVKKLRRNGLDHVFKIYEKKIQEFASKYSFKKFTIIPKLNQTVKITQRYVLSSIVNHKLFGMDLKVKGQKPIQIFKWLLLMKVQKIRFKNLKIAINRIEKVKNQFKYDLNYYRMRRIYKAMIDKRWKFVNFKLGSFAENQRRLIEESMRTSKKPDVEIHILASISTPAQLQTYYKWNERKKAQLTRLYNNQADHIILILNREDSFQHWVEDIQNLSSSWKKPKIHFFFSSINQSSPQECADIYFGLSKEQIKQIKKICDGKMALVIPYQITLYLSKICETLGANLFAGTFTQQSKTILFEDNDEEQQNIQASKSTNAKFRKLQLPSQDLNNFYIQKFKKIQLANELFLSKSKVKKLFQSLKVPTPITISMQDMNECDFFRQFVKAILTHKQYSKWILKLPHSTFSRGLAFLQTQSLKILKDTKKKSFIQEQDINQISNIIEEILIQKIYLPHQSLMSGDQFINLFKKKQGYIQNVLQNHTTISIFGRIQMNGLFTLLGSCKKCYAENVCFGALYPAQVNNEMIKHINSTALKVYEMGVFGYISFEVLLNEKTKQCYFIDLIPHLDQYSSFYFYYKRMLDINEFDSNGFNKLKRYAFYCPFIDNNGNKFKSIKEIQDRLHQKKLKFDQQNLQGFKYLYLNQDTPSVLSIAAFSKQQGNVIKNCLDGLKFLVQNGGQFNKFDKKYKNSQTDGLYIMDIIWRMRQIKKQVDK